MGRFRRGRRRGVRREWEGRHGLVLVPLREQLFHVLLVGSLTWIRVDVRWIDGGVCGGKMEDKRFSVVLCCCVLNVLYAVRRPSHRHDFRVRT